MLKGQVVRKILVASFAILIAVINAPKSVGDGYFPEDTDLTVVESAHTKSVPLLYNGTRQLYYF